MRRTILLGSLLVAALAPPAHADDVASAPTPTPPPTPFDRGRFGLTAGGGTTTSLGVHYVVIGAGVGYFVLPGVELGLSALHQFGDGPSISKVSPSIRYLVQPLVGRSPVIPYVGVFYNHWFIGSDYPDVDTIGARTGLVYVSGQIVLGLGVVFEHTVSTCATNCNDVYPDVTISLAL